MELHDVQNVCGIVITILEVSNSESCVALTDTSFRNSSASGGRDRIFWKCDFRTYLPDWYREIVLDN